MSGNADRIARRARGLALIPAVLVLVQCERRPAEPEPARPVAESPPPEPAIAPAPTAMNRAELLAAMAAAASAYAAGQRPAGADPLAGRTFAIRLPFGCGGPADAPAEGAARPAGQASAVWGPRRETIRLAVTPADWRSAPVITEAGVEAEAVEGFWIPRPWLTADACPGSGLSGTHEPVVTPQSVGLAAVFSKEDSRVGRRNGRAYEFTVRPTGDTPPAPGPLGYRLVLEGRLETFPDGRVIRCRAQGPDQRPVCLAAMRLDRVAFVESGNLLSEWRGG